MKNLLLLMVLVVSHSYIKSSVKQELALECLFGTAKGVAIGYGLMTAGIIFKELGHSIAGNILNNKRININLGAQSYDQEKEILFTFGGFNFFSTNIVGKYNYAKNCRALTNTSSQNVIISLSGPLLGLLFSATAFRYIPLNLISFNLLYLLVENNIHDLILPAKNYDETCISNSSYRALYVTQLYENSTIKKLSNNSLKSRRIRKIIGLALSAIFVHYTYTEPVLCANTSIEPICASILASCLLYPCFLLCKRSLAKLKVLSKNSRIV